MTYAFCLMRSNTSMRLILAEEPPFGASLFLITIKQHLSFRVFVTLHRFSMLLFGAAV